VNFRTLNRWLIVADDKSATFKAKDYRIGRTRPLRYRKRCAAKSQWCFIAPIFARPSKLWIRGQQEQR
jgi:hypothetical protein